VSDECVCHFKVANVYILFTIYIAPAPERLIRGSSSLYCYPFLLHYITLLSI